MSNFEIFITSDSTQDSLKNISEHLEGFIQEVEKLDPIPIRKRLTAWLANFKDLDGVNYDVLLQLLKSINFYNDDRVDDSFRKTLLRYATSKGLPNDFTNFNDNRPPYLFHDINTLLKRIAPIEDSIIVFLDDIMQTGGQLNSIFKRYLGVKLKKGETKDEYENRVEIETQTLKMVFRSKKILLFFFNTFVEGQAKIAEVLKNELQLDVEILVGNDTQLTDKGFFGTTNDIEHILNGSTKTFVDGPLQGKQYKDIRQTYLLLKEAGYELLKADRIEKELNKQPNEKWTNELYENRSLGYGNGAKLFLGHQNVPTSTITALWLPVPENSSKAIKIQGKEIFWQPLFYRKTKKLEGSSKKIINELYPRVPVTKTLDNGHLVDVNLYDLITLTCLQRKSSISIYAHDPFEIKELAKIMNKLEEDFYDKGNRLHELSKREWFSFHLTLSNRTTIDNEINEAIDGLKSSSIGILLTLHPDTIHGDNSGIQGIVSRIYENNPTKVFSVLIDYPSRNSTTLQLIRRALSSIKTTNLFISNLIGKADEIDHPWPNQSDHLGRLKLTTLGRSKLTTP
jgi:hypothetical protein